MTFATLYFQTPGGLHFKREISLENIKITDLLSVALRCPLYIMHGGNKVITTNHFQWDFQREISLESLIKIINLLSAICSFAVVSSLLIPPLSSSSPWYLSSLWQFLYHSYRISQFSALQLPFCSASTSNLICHHHQNVCHHHYHKSLNIPVFILITIFSLAVASLLHQYLNCHHH